MKLTDKIATQRSAYPFFSFEFFPPRTDQGFENLISRIARLVNLKPAAISVTWGAGGSTKSRSLDLAGLIQSEYGVDTILHLTCTNMEQGMVHGVLQAAKDRGIQNILALRGDPPRGQEEWIPIDPRFQHGIDLAKYIRSTPEFASYFCVGVAGYSEGHPDHLLSEEQELEYLKQKVDAGADFIVTQLFYDVDRFLVWLKKVREKGITLPVIPGVMPIQTYSSFLRLTKLCGIKVPDKISNDLATIGHDDQQVKDYGVKLAVEMITRIISESDVRWVHFCTLNLEKSIQRILETLGWTGVTAPIHNKLITDPNDAATPHLANGDLNVSDLLVTPSTATNSATLGLANIPPGDGEVGRGELNNASTWDEFPNGRFGDFKSPAYGNQDPWGGSTISRDAAAAWGHPKSLDDLTQILMDYLHSKIPSTPFSQTPLSSESLTILPHLERLTTRGWWTVGSQPAVDGASSSDQVFGWGPRGGYVFQKGFVEFFCEESDVDAIEKKVEEKGNGWVHWFAGNRRGECRGNVPENARNAVTWGVFPGQEIVQTTIIEKESFLSWNEEAFSIWSDWASFYRPDSAERKLLEGVRDRRWLVSIMHHDYKDPTALWGFLFQDGELA